MAIQTGTFILIDTDIFTVMFIGRITVKVTLSYNHNHSCRHFTLAIRDPY